MSPEAQGEPACRLTLPVPPSANNLFVNRRFGRGRARSPAYEVWVRTAGWTGKLQWLEQSSPRVTEGARVLIEAGVNHTRDLDNLAKPILDLLVSLGIIDDDRWVDDLRIVRITKDAGSCRVSIWPMG